MLVDDHCRAVPQLLVCMFNGLVDMNSSQWSLSAMDDYMYELDSLESFSHVFGVPIVLILGADVRLWHYAPHPEAYVSAQNQIINHARNVGLVAHTGMEEYFAGGFGQ